MTQLLSDVRVIDLTGYIMGPLASRMLGDMGADVIKVEPPAGDTLRTQRPLLADDIGGLFLNLHRNKRSIVLDLKSDEGRATLERLIASADVLMHNLRSPVMARLGFDYDRCRAIKPDIIYCASYGYGAAGPYAAKPAYDDLIQAASGFASLSEDIQGEAAYTPSVIFDKVVGQVTANAILGALYHRARTGKGQAIEVPMLEVAIDFNLVEHIGGYALVPPNGPIGSPRIRTNERRPFATADGFVCILPYSDRNWRDFFVFTGRDDLLADDKYTSIATRQDHLATLYAAIRQAAPLRSTAEWVAFCDAIGGCADRSPCPSRQSFPRSRASRRGDLSLDPVAPDVQRKPFSYPPSRAEARSAYRRNTRRTRRFRRYDAAQLSMPSTGRNFGRTTGQRYRNAVPVTTLSAMLAASCTRSNC